jgi:hypothetical protein
LVFTDEAMQVTELFHHSPLGKSDHSVITFKFHCYLDYTKPKDRFVFAKGDYEAMRNNLTNSNWKEEYIASGNNKTVEELWFSLKSKLLDLRNQHVPKETASNKPSWK